MTESLLDVDSLGVEDLKRLVLLLLEEIAVLKVGNAALREEIARLKGLKGRPNIKPSGMEKQSQAKAKPGRRKGRRRRPNGARLCIDEDRVLEAGAPAGSRFKGYEDFIVQELIVKPRVIRYRRERCVNGGVKLVQRAAQNWSTLCDAERDAAGCPGSP